MKVITDVFIEHNNINFSGSFYEKEGKKFIMFMVNGNLVENKEVAFTYTSEQAGSEITKWVEETKVLYG